MSGASPGSAGANFVHRPLFAVGALYSAVVVPIGVLLHAGMLPGWPAGPHWHGHEMLFGFALAIIGGYLVTRATRRALAVALALWALGRVAAAFGWPPLWGPPAALAFPVCVFVLAGLPMLRAAKRWRNAMFAPVLAGFVAAELLFLAGVAGIVDNGAMQGLALGISLVALLLFLMGGRVIAAAASGALQRQGAPHRDMAQVRVEAAGAAALCVMAAGLVAGLPAIASVGAAAACACATTRLARWSPAVHTRRRELLPMLAGYVWLAAGLAILAAASAGAFLVADALHGVAAGALGTLATTMTVRVSLQRARRPLALPGPGIAAVALVTLATLARLAAPAAGPQMPLVLVVAALCWSLAFATVALVVLQLRPAAAPRRA